MAADNIISNIVLDAAMSAPLSDREKALRDLFVREYLVDYNAINACLRCGFMRSFAKDYADKFMDEPYVRQQLRLVEETAPVLPHQGNADAEAYHKQRIITGLMREAHYHGEGATPAARVAALGKLAVIYGMDQKVVVDPNKGRKQYRGGVIQVPEIADVTKWEDVAQVTQEKLVADVRS